MDRREALHALGVAAASMAALTSGVSPAAEAAAHEHMPGDMHSQHYAACAHACAECMNACESCLQHCIGLVAAGQREHVNSLTLCDDCGELCGSAAKITARGGPLTVAACQACAAACDACAAQCEKFAKDAHMTACAQSCRACAKACRTMIRQLGA